MWPFSLLTESAQVALLAAGCALIGALIGYFIKDWLDRREYERRRKQEQEQKRAEERLKNSLIRSATMAEIQEYAPPPLMKMERRVERIPQGPHLGLLTVVLSLCIISFMFSLASRYLTPDLYQLIQNNVIAFIGIVILLVTLMAVMVIFILKKY